MERNKRLANSADSPYTAPEWPVLAIDDEADIVDLLCKLLEPVGAYRKEHIKPSRGKSSRKRKRKSSTHESPVPAVSAAPAPAPPDLLSHITLGFNTTIRHLESLATVSRPPSLGGANPKRSDDAAATPVQPLAPLSAVFICHTALPPILTSSFPLLSTTASQAYPEEPPTRLVPLGKTAEEKIAQALHQPRVGFVGLQSNTPGAKILLDLVRDRVRAVDVPWLREASSGVYLPVKVKQSEVKVGSKKEKAAQPTPHSGDHQ